LSAMMAPSSTRQLAVPTWSQPFKSIEQLDPVRAGLTGGRRRHLQSGEACDDEPRSEGECASRNVWHAMCVASPQAPEIVASENDR
jgi:hypothetical protein